VSSASRTEVLLAGQPGGACGSNPPRDFTSAACQRHFPLALPIAAGAPELPDLDFWRT
jgi:hypothetical protein